MDLFGSSGARGPVETDLGPTMVLHIALAAVIHWEADRVAIGRDVRVTGPSLQAAAVAGATGAGADVETLGVAPTPAIQYYAAVNDIPAIVITASHNPPADNGVKLIADDGGEVSIPTYEAIESSLERQKPTVGPWDTFGSVTAVDGLAARYVDDICRAVDADAISAADLHVVVDAGTGTAGATTPALCRQLGCEVTTLNAQPDGHFPARQSEPVPEALEGLSSAVASTDADLGVAHDGDADRAVFVDASGAIIDGGATLSALAKAVAEPGDSIVAAITAPHSLKEVADSAASTLELTPVGAAHVLTRVRELQARGDSVAIAGEQNGGIIFPSFRLSRDGGYILATMLERVVEMPLSELVAPFTDRVYRRQDLPLEDHQASDRMLEAVKRWGQKRNGSVTEIDGVRVDLDDEWILIRPSGTEPLVRIYIEAATEEAATALLEAVTEAIEE